MPGHKLGSTRDSSKWRCPICKFCNALEVETCKTCKEPRPENATKPKPVVPRAANPRARRSTGTTTTTSTASKAPGAAARRRGSAATSGVRGGRGSKSVLGQKENRAGANSTGARGSARTGARTSSVSARKSSAAAPRPAARKTTKASVNKNKVNGKHIGDLGYVSKKGNHGKIIGSRLNQATAAYQAKFDKEDSGPPKKGGNIMTLGGMKVNGFTKSSAGIARARKAQEKRVNPHDNIAAPRPAKYSQRGGLGNVHSNKSRRAQDGPTGGLLGMLQQACSSKAVASLKHKDRPIVASEQKRLANGTMTKLAM